MRDEFSVYQFFVTGEYERVRSFVSAEEATRAFRHYTNNVATAVGIIEKVIITDGGDHTVAEWKKDEGITWPKEGETMKLYRKKQMIEVERWSPGIDMEGVSVSDADKANGSPKTGDVIARNSDGDPKDRWLISQATFERTYEPF